MLEDDSVILEARAEQWGTAAQLPSITKNQSKKIPLLNTVALHNLKDGHLVRFRGMIQDMHNPEFYLERYEIIDKNTKEVRLASGKYRDTSDIGESEALNYSSPNLISAERQTITVISLPGFNDWARNVEIVSNDCPHLVNPPSTSKNPDLHPNSKLKRSLDAEDDENGSESMELDDNIEKTKKEKHLDSSLINQHVNVSRDHILNFPLPDENGKVCIVKVYDKYEALKINDMVEVIGFLSVDPVLSNQWNSSREPGMNEEVDVETLTHNPPPSLVPRIHAVCIEKLDHCNPLLELDFDKEKLLEEANVAREHLHVALTQVLFGDSLAADYLICHLISHVYIRRDMLSLGKFTLNLLKIPSQQCPNFTTQLYSMIESIVTKSYYLPLTIDNLNDLSFVPKKDYECNRLTSGILQLSKNTHLLIDETKMQPGQLNNAGVLNLATLGHVIQNQRVKYDFKFYEMEYECDLPILILSEGKSLLPNEVSLPLVVDDVSLGIIDEVFKASNYYLNPTLLNKIRTYITTMQLIDYSITEEPQYIQDDFVSMRQADGKEATADDLHRLLVLTRLVCLSRGFNTINQQCWDIAKNMENQRHARLQNKL